MASIAVAYDLVRKNRGMMQKAKVSYGKAHKIRTTLTDKDRLIQVAKFLEKDDDD